MSSRDESSMNEVEAHPRFPLKRIGRRSFLFGSGLGVVGFMAGCAEPDSAAKVGDTGSDQISDS